MHIMKEDVIMFKNIKNGFNSGIGTTVKQVTIAVGTYYGINLAVRVIEDVLYSRKLKKQKQLNEELRQFQSLKDPDPFGMMALWDHAIKSMKKDPSKMN